MNPNEYNEGSRSYLFGVNLDRCIGTCNALNCLSNEVSAPNEKKVILEFCSYDYRNKCIRKKVPVDFCNGSNHNYHFMIK